MAAAARSNLRRDRAIGHIRMPALLPYFILNLIYTCLPHENLEGMRYIVSNLSILISIAGPQVDASALLIGSAILYFILFSVPAWTTTMEEKEDSEHDPLVIKELDYSRLWAFSDESENSKTRRPSLCAWLLILELVNLACFISGYFILIKAREQIQHQLDDYGSLSIFNKSWDYSNHSTVSEPHEGRTFYHETWEDMASHHGLVSVTKEWAALHGLPPSAPTPDIPGELVYQMDGFHAMHCLHMIRGNLVENYHFDDHTRHCLDYIRHTLMCNVDVTLAGLDKRNLLGAESSYAIHTCRDYDAVVRWSVANRWENLSEWLENNL